jgi:hypothetical protein
LNFGSGARAFKLRAHVADVEIVRRDGGRHADQPDSRHGAGDGVCAIHGDGWVAGAFQVAFTMPNLFRRLLGEGALTAAFIPIFKEKEKTGPPAEMCGARPTR